MNTFRLSMMVVGMMVFGAPTLAMDITVKVKGEQLAFEPAEFTVKSGEKVNLTFVNVSKNMAHNWVLGKPGTTSKIGTDSQNVGEQGGWVSSGPEVLAKTKMVQPTKSEKISFTAPTEKGSYPYLCTFPGHWVIMKGSMIVK